MKVFARLSLLVCLLAAMGAAGTSVAGVPTAENPRKNEDLQRLASVSGHYGGFLTIGQRAEPKTLNPVTASDSASREVIRSPPPVRSQRRSSSGS